MFYLPYHQKWFIEYVKKEPALKNLKWSVKAMSTESIGTKQQCSWQRVQAGDTTRRMVLELKRIDGKSYQDCVRQDVFNAAGDMFDAPCMRIRIKKKTKPTQERCLFSIEDKKTDLSGYEAVI